MRMFRVEWLSELRAVFGDIPLVTQASQPEKPLLIISDSSAKRWNPN